jgi:hypothetical protein
MCDHVQREEAMVVIERAAGGVPTVWCDPCLEPLIRALNAAGLATIASCCGHGRLPATVALADGRYVTVTDYDPTPVLAPGRTINDPR